MAYTPIPNLTYLGNQVYYKTSGEKEPAPIAMATAVSSSNLRSVDAYPVYEPLNSNSNSNYNGLLYDPTRSDVERDVVKKIKYKNKIYLRSIQTGIIYNLEQDEVGIWDETTQKIIFDDPTDEPTSSGGNKIKSYRRRRVSAKRKSRKSRK